MQRILRLKISPTIQSYEYNILTSLVATVYRHPDGAADETLETSYATTNVSVVFHLPLDNINCMEEDETNFNFYGTENVAHGLRMGNYARHVRGCARGKGERNDRGATGRVKECDRCRRVLTVANMARH